MSSALSINQAIIGASLPAGVTLPYAGATAPVGYLVCDGSQVSRSTYPSLFAAIGTLHGAGDGSTTFNLPDLRGKFMRGAMPTTLNSIAGSGTVATNNATFTNHNINRTGMKVRLISGTLSGLSGGVDYYAIVVNSNTLAFATTLANAIAGTKIAISGTNTSTISQWEDPDTSARTSPTVGAASSSVGSFQTDAVGPHQHQVYANMGAGGGGFGSSAPGQPVGGSYGARATTIDSGNRSDYENRPQNVAMNYIIKT